MVTVVRHGNYGTPGLQILANMALPMALGLVFLYLSGTILVLPSFCTLYITGLHTFFNGWTRSFHAAI